MAQSHAHDGPATPTDDPETYRIETTDDGIVEVPTDGAGPCRLCGDRVHTSTDGDVYERTDTGEYAPHRCQEASA